MGLCCAGGRDSGSVAMPIGTMFGIHVSVDYSDTDEKQGIESIKRNLKRISIMRLKDIYSKYP